MSEEKRLRVVPVTITDARAHVARWHSHLGPPVGGLLASAVAEGDRIVCVAILGRPVSRVLQAQGCAEVTRVASDGTVPHAASMALGAIRKAALALGWRRLVSSTLLGEAGTSYRAAGWHPVALGDGGEWAREDRPRDASAQPGGKVRWETGPDALPLDSAADAALREAVGRVAFAPRPEPELPLFDSPR